MTNIFESAGSSIFRDITYLENSYIPPQLIGREEELNLIASAYQPIIMKSSPRNLFLLGKPGSGKNVANAFVVNQLKNTVKKSDLDMDVVFLQISCKKANTSTSVMKNIINQYRPDIRVPNRGLGLDEYYDIFAEMFDNDKHQVIIIMLDEIERLKDDDVLYMLSRAEETRLLNNQTKVSIVGTSNDFEYKQKMDPAIASSMYMKDVMFMPYKEEQLEKILSDRIYAFKEGVVDDDVISLCSKLSAREHGDARRAIQLLKEAGHIADRSGNSRVSILNVYEADEAVDVDCLNEMILGLPDQQKMILLSVIQSESISNVAKTGDVIAKYNSLCKRYNFKALSRQRVSQIITDLKKAQLICINKVMSKDGNSRELWLNKEIKKQSTVVESTLLKCLYYQT
jgi:cell division control protein 6